MRTSKTIAIVVGLLLSCGVVIYVARSSLRNANGNKMKETTVTPSNTSPIQRTVVSPLVPRPNNAFARMSFQDRNLAVNRLRKLKSAALLNAWIESDRIEHDPLKRNLIGALLARALRLNDDTNKLTYSEISAFLDSNANPLSSRALLLWVLGQAATPESLDLIISTATDPSRIAIAHLALQEIQTAAAEQWDGHFHPELSPALEAAWRASSNSEMLQTTALAIAEIGAPDGIKMLIDATVNGAQDALRSQSASSALSHITNPDAVPVLSGVLMEQSGVNRTSTLIGDSLASMLNQGSATALLDWLKNEDDAASPLARKFVMESRPDATLSVWKTSTSPRNAFKSEAVRQAIIEGLSEYTKSRRSTL